MVREEETKKRALQDAHKHTGSAVRVVHYRDDQGQSRTVYCAVRMGEGVAHHPRFMRRVAAKPPDPARCVMPHAPLPPLPPVAYPYSHLHAYTHASMLAFVPPCLPAPPPVFPSLSPPSSP